MKIQEIQGLIATSELPLERKMEIFSAFSQLKAYQFTRTNNLLEVENNYITVSVVMTFFDDLEVVVSFLSHESVEARFLGNPRNVPFEMRIKLIDMLLMMIEPLNTETESLLPLVFLSNRIWEKALTTPFIRDWSELDSEGIPSLKSLTDLNATLIQ